MLLLKSLAWETHASLSQVFFCSSSQETQYLFPYFFSWLCYAHILQPRETNVIPITQEGNEVILMKHDKLLLYISGTDFMGKGHLITQ